MPTAFLSTLTDHSSRILLDTTHNTSTMLNINNKETFKIQAM